MNNESTPPPCLGKKHAQSHENDIPSDVQATPWSMASIQLESYEILWSWSLISRFIDCGFYKIVTSQLAKPDLPKLAHIWPKLAASLGQGWQFWLGHCLGCTLGQPWRQTGSHGWLPRLGQGWAMLRKVWLPGFCQWIARVSPMNSQAMPGNCQGIPNE